MQAHKVAPSDMQCRDKFLIQSVIAPYGAANKDVIQEMVSWRDGCLRFMKAYNLVMLDA